MKSRGKFIIGILLMLVAVLVIEYRMPRRFIWQPTFSHSDAQPFGCLVFDSVMKASMPNGYTVSRQTFFQLYSKGILTHPKHYKDSVVTSPKSLVIITNEILGKGARDHILQIVDEGNTVLLASSSLAEWADTLGIDFHWNRDFQLDAVAGQMLDKGNLQWQVNLPKDSAYQHTKLCQSVYPQMIERTLSIPDSVYHQDLIIYHGMRMGETVSKPLREHYFSQQNK